MYDLPRIGLYSVAMLLVFGADLPKKCSVYPVKNAFRKCFRKMDGLFCRPSFLIFQKNYLSLCIDIHFGSCQNRYCFQWLGVSSAPWCGFCDIRYVRSACRTDTGGSAAGGLSVYTVSLDHELISFQHSCRIPMQKRIFPALAKLQL